MLLVDDNADDANDVDNVDDADDADNAKENDNRLRKKKDHVSTLISIESSDS
jgi:hypothetical protein